MQRPLDYFHLGVRGVIAGDPDGMVSGDLLVTGDGTGGTQVAELHYGDVTEGPDKLDVMMRFNWITVNASVAAGADVNVSFNKTLPWGGTAARRLMGTAVLPDDDFLRQDFSGGLWLFPQKGDSIVFTLVGNNVNTAILQIVVHGYFWYMGRLRRRLMENPLE